MSEPIVIVVAGEARPFSKKVASWTARDGRFGTHAYDSAKYAGWKDQARYTAAQIMNGRPPLSCPIDFRVKIFFPIPESWSRRKQHLAENGLLRPTITPDVDNLCKAAADSLIGIAMRDDKYIVAAHISKHYSRRPRVEMEVREINMDEQEELGL